MAEYIDREALIAEYDRVHIGAPGGARKLMVDAPAADVEEIVRCKNCTYSAIQNGCDSLYCYFLDIAMGENDFCSYGERRKEND